MKLKTRPRGFSVFVLASSTGAIFLTALFVMLWIGMIHSIHPVVPTVDYWSTFGVLAVLRGVYQFVVMDWDKKAREDLDG